MAGVFTPSKEKELSLSLQTGKPKKEGAYLVIYYHYPKNRCFRDYDDFKSFEPYHDFGILGFGKKTTFDTVNEWYNIEDYDLCVETPDFWCEFPEVSEPPLPKRYKELGENLKRDEKESLQKKISDLEKI